MRIFVLRKLDFTSNLTVNILRSRRVAAAGKKVVSMKRFGQRPTSLLPYNSSCMPSSALVGLTICMQALCCSSRSPQPLYRHGFERFELFVACNSYRSNMGLRMRHEYPMENRRPIETQLLNLSSSLLRAIDTAAAFINDLDMNTR